MNEDYNKGIEDGIENIDKNSHEDFLANEVNLTWLKESHQKLIERAENLKREINETSDKRIVVLEEMQKIKPDYDLHKHQIDLLENEKAFLKQKIEETKAEKLKNPINYPFLAGVIYLVAGVVFLLGDLIISHEIVAYALNIKNNLEAWAFAAGLASVTLLLKPAYERLVEDPYQNEPNAKTKKVHHVFQVVLVSLAVISLSILGWFRYEAYKVDKLKAGINQEVKSLQLNSTPLIQGNGAAAVTDNTSQIEAKIKQMEQLNTQLVNSNWALLSFVLSGVLFAIAGAICFGISFPILSSFSKRWLWHNPSINKAKRKIRRLDKKLKTEKTEWFKYQSKLDLFNEKLVAMGSLENLREEQKGVKEELAVVSEKIRNFTESLRISDYNNGYEKGQNQKEFLSAEELKNYRKGLAENLKQSREDSVDKTPRVIKSNGLRPHHALRKAISDSFNEN